MDEDILSGNSSNYHKRLKYIHVKNQESFQNMSTIIVFMLCLIYAKEKWKIDLCFSYYMKSILSMFVKIRSAILGMEPMFHK